MTIPERARSSPPSTSSGHRPPIDPVLQIQATLTDRDHLLLEMEDSVCGNAAWGENRITRYPWGAHYLPLPSRESMHVRHMLHEFGILQDGVDSEEPAYEERFLVHAPEERVALDPVGRRAATPARRGCGRYAVLTFVHRSPSFCSSSPRSF